MFSRSNIFLLITILAFASRCTAQSAVGIDATNEMDSIIRKETNAERKRFFESLMPEIRKKQTVESLIQNELRTSDDIKVQAWRDFLLKWPSSKQNIGFAWQKDTEMFKGEVDATAIIEDRYLLQIILDCNVTKDYNQIAFTKLRFSFEGVKTVSIQPGGASSVTFDTQTQRWFGLSEWNRLKEASWDFSKIGINVVSNTPVPHIHEAFK